MPEGSRTRAAEVRSRVAAYDWHEIAESLDSDGFARLPALLTATECRTLRDCYAEDARFRKRVSMQQHRFGAGEYKYFAYPLPPLVAALRTAFYPRLARIANTWLERLGAEDRFPASHRAFLARCHAHGQKRPTPLLLHYGPGDYNRLHQDLYGAVAFPLQLTCQLSRPGRDFRGGEFLLVEQRPRMQSQGEAVALRQGEAILFPTRERPVPSARGFTRAALRHGVSRLHRGRRTTLGIIFHDAT